MNMHPGAGAWRLDTRWNVVLFAGMGGACDGLERAGYPVHLAINHDEIACAVHARRHPHTRHIRSDVFETCPRAATGGRAVGILWASPDCTHFSAAKGSKPLSPRRRSLAWVICRWLGQARPEIVGMENVAEIQGWGPLVAKRCPATGRVMKLDGTVAARGEWVPVREQHLVPDKRHKGRIWKAFKKHVAGLGYSFDVRVLVCADYGVPTIRKRLYGVMRRDGGAIAWPEPSHAPRDKAKALGLRPWVGAHTIIDWSLPVKSIFGRKKPLADATLRRTARGVMRYVVNAAKPFIVPITHSGADRVHSVDDPLRTITTAHRGELAVGMAHVAKFRTGASGADIEEPLATFTANGFRKRPGGAVPLGLVGATLIQTGYGERKGQAPRSLDIGDPAGTQVAGGSKTALVASFLAQHNTGEPGRPATEPVSTLVARGSTQGVVAATLGNLRGTNRHGRSPDEPLSTQSAGGSHAHLICAFLETYYSTGAQDNDIVTPLGSCTGKARHGVVTVKVGRETYYIDDIGLRMLEPEEGAASHGFKPGDLPATIVVDGVEKRLTKTQKYHLVGNSVAPEMSRLIIAENMRPALAAGREAVA